jgi:hypothetical protein
MANTVEAEPQIIEPQAKRVRVLGPAMPYPAKRVAAPTSTLAFITSPSETARESAPTVARKAKPLDSGFDIKKDEWKAPAGQDGSGKTKLNEKFAGRY